MKTPAKLNILKSNLVVIVLALTIGFTHQQCTSSKANEQENKKESAIPVKIAQEQLQELVQALDVSGIVVASKEHRLSFKTGGIIDKIMVNEGQSVRKGQLLATLKLNEIEAQVHQSHLAMEKATRDFERIQNLFSDSVTTLEQFQNVTTALEIAKSNVEIAEYNRRYSKIEAPANGLILMKLNETNELVGPGTPVLIMASKEEAWQVKAGVTDKEVVSISLDDRATVKLDAYPNQVLDAYVCQIGDAPDQLTGLYEVKMSLTPSDLQLKPGFFANAQIVPNRKQTYLTIPIEAVTEGIGNTVTYFALSPDRTKAIQKTATVKWIEKNRVVLGSSIEKPDAIVIESPKELNDLARIEVVAESQLPQTNRTY